MTVAFLLVTCCLEQSRAEILAEVVQNLREQAPNIPLAVFDNASTISGVTELLKSNFQFVFQSNKNVGYWSAIDWWLDELGQAQPPPDFTYIIESDMIHYNFAKLWDCAAYLEKNPDVGSCRLHEYSIADQHLYNKDAPQPNSRRNLWQSHTNRATSKPVIFSQSDGDIWTTTFLTQLPALNRFPAMREAFSYLRKKGNFTELDFQRAYWAMYQRTAILDGGIFNCDLNPYNAGKLTGSWSSPEQLKQIGYQTTRVASITPRDQYTVSRL